MVEEGEHDTDLDTLDGSIVVCAVDALLGVLKVLETGLSDGVTFNHVVSSSKTQNTKENAQPRHRKSILGSLSLVSGLVDLSVEDADSLHEVRPHHDRHPVLVHFVEDLHPQLGNVPSRQRQHVALCNKVSHRLSRPPFPGVVDGLVESILLQRVLHLWQSKRRDGLGVGFRLSGSGIVGRHFDLAAGCSCSGVRHIVGWVDTELKIAGRGVRRRRHSR